MIELKGISKIYRDVGGGAVEVLADMDLIVQSGVFAAVVGASGSGKSSLLLVLGGLLHPEGGRMVINGQDMSRASADEWAKFRPLNIGFVFQRFHLLPYLTVRENIMAAAIASPTPPENPEDRLEELTRRLGIGHRTKHLPNALSVGEMQRTALARALFNRPRIILADEPTGNLDPDNSGIVLDCFTEFASEGGTVLMVTHNPEDTQRADKVWLLDKGKLAAGA